MLKLAAIKRIFAEDSIIPEERQENLLEVPCVRSHATDKHTHAPTYYRDIIVFEKAFEERFREAPFRDDLVWTEGPPIEIKLRFQIPLD